MMRAPRSLQRLIGAALLLACGAAAAAESPTSLAALFGRLPELPPSAEAAAAWVDKKSGQVVHAPLVALNGELAAHQRAVGAIIQSRQGHQQAQTDLQVKALSKGMADVGIDMERMQRDPAYAAQVQARLQSMTPAQMIALSQQMSQPMNDDRRIDNEAALVARETPAVQAAGDAGFAYANAQLARMQARDAIWREADEAVARIHARPLKVAAPKPRMEWDNIGCDKGCQAAWDTYASQMLPLMIARENEILGVRRAALQRHRAAVAPEIQAAERHLAATQYGAAAKSNTNLMRITGYDGAAAGEVQQLLTRIEDTVKRAAIVPNCGKQIVLVPGAVCQ